MLVTFSHFPSVVFFFFYFLNRKFLLTLLTKSIFHVNSLSKCSMWWVTFFSSTQVAKRGEVNHSSEYFESISQTNNFSCFVRLFCKRARLYHNTHNLRPSCGVNAYYKYFTRDPPQLSDETVSGRIPHEDTVCWTG